MAFIVYLQRQQQWMDVAHTHTHPHIPFSVFLHSSYKSRLIILCKCAPCLGVCDVCVCVRVCVCRGWGGAGNEEDGWCLRPEIKVRCRGEPFAFAMALRFPTPLVSHCVTRGNPASVLHALTQTHLHTLTQTHIHTHTHMGTDTHTHKHGLVFVL